MVEELLLLLRCHYVASGDPAKLSLLSKEWGPKDGLCSSYLSRAQN